MAPLSATMVASAVLVQSTCHPGTEVAVLLVVHSKSTFSHQVYHVFADTDRLRSMVANLGPISPTMAGQAKVNSSFAYNPRCLKRDLSAYTASSWLTTTNLVNLTLGNAASTIETFQNELQGRFPQGFLGLHAAGHFSIGGDAGDLFSSPVDPVFFLHHAMLDRVWWIWQALHLNQAETIAGTITLFNNPPSRNTTLEDTIYMGQSNAPVRPISELLNSLGDSPFCYIYL